MMKISTPRPANERTDQAADRAAAPPAVSARPAATQSQLLLSPLAEQTNFRPLVAWFVNSLELRLGAMEQASRLGAWHDLAALARQLRDGGASYGYPTISRAAADLEEAVRSRLIGQIEGRYQQLRAQCDAAARGLDRLPREG